MRKIILPVTFFLTIWLVQSNEITHLQSSPEWLQKVDAQVWETAVSSTAPTEFLVYLSDQADVSVADSLSDKTTKGEYVYKQLTAVAQQTQPALITQLDSLSAPYRRFWIANMLWVEGDASVIAAMAARTDVARIDANPSVLLHLPETAVSPLLMNDTQSIGWGLSRVQADKVWVFGYTGQGVVIGGQDTGYNWTHPGLINQYRGWNGATANHDYNWHDAIHENNPATGTGNPCGFDSPTPCDDQYHGTHTMGTMVGNDMDASNPAWPAGAANAVGMAPGARWIGCRNMEQGYGTPATYAECYEWFVAPYPVGGDPMIDGEPALAPHVINNSWGCPDFEGCTDPNVLLAVVNNVRAAGIVTVHSAGNEGASTCGTIQNPAAIYDSSFTVGNTTIFDDKDLIHSSSSIGPVTVDGSNRLKPDIVAPGTNIRSTIPGGGYAFLTGTSMAGPHVAGLVALLISVDPSLAGDVDRIEQMIKDSADPLTTTKACGGDTSTSVPNHVYGYGRINAFSAIDPYLQHNFIPLLVQTP